MTRNWRRNVVAAAAGGALCLSGCSMLPGGLGGPAEDDPAEVDDVIDDSDTAEDDHAAESGPDEGVAEEAEPAAEGLDPLPVASQPIDTTVHANGLEYTIEAMDVIDLDAEAEQETRMQGASLVFNGSVTNPGSDSAASNTPVTLQWEDPNSGHSFETTGRASSDAVPGGASGPLEIELNLGVDHLETFEAGTALLILGQPGASPAQIPLGDGEPITRIPVPQPDLAGQSFDIDGQVTVTIEEADLRWDIDGGAEDGTAVLDLTVELANDSGGQRCWSRGTGNNFSLVQADGTGTVDMSMSDRGCTASGDRSVSRTGILVHEEFAGDYTLTHDHGIDFDEFEESIEFTMVDEPGVLLSER